MGEPTPKTTPLHTQVEIAEQLRLFFINTKFNLKTPGARRTPGVFLLSRIYRGKGHKAFKRHFSIGQMS